MGPVDPAERAEDNIEWCERYLFLPEGKHVGQRLQMAEFMKDDFRAIRRNQTAILTKLDNISEEIRAMEVRFGALETRFSAMEERMAGVEVRLDRLVIPRM